MNGSNPPSGPEAYTGWLSINHGPWERICTGATWRRCLASLCEHRPSSWPVRRRVVPRGDTPLHAPAKGMAS